MVRLIGLSLAAVAAIAAAAEPALACSCVCPRDARLLLRDFPYVLYGRVLSHRDAGGQRRVFAFEVMRPLKGDLPARITVETPRDGFMCGILAASMLPRTEHFIAVRRKGDAYYFDSCMVGCLQERRGEVERILSAEGVKR